MSRTIIKTHSAPIYINKNTTKYNYSMPFSNFSKYLFELKLTLKDNQIKYFRKIENKKKSELISYVNNIKYDSIKTYDINITIIPDKIETIYSLSGTLTNDLNSSINSNKNIFIEFSKNNNNSIICLCHFIGKENKLLSCSPLI